MLINVPVNIQQGCPPKQSILPSTCCKSFSCSIWRIKLCGLQVLYIKLNRRSIDNYLGVQQFSTVLPQGGSLVGSPFGAIGHHWLQIQFSIMLPQGGSFVGSPFGAMGHCWLQIQFSIVTPQGGSFVGSLFGAMGHRLLQIARLSLQLPLQWLSSSIFGCSFGRLSRISDISSHLHYMMLQSIQTIYFL